MNRSSYFLCLIAASLFSIPSAAQSATQNGAEQAMKLSSYQNPVNSYDVNGDGCFTKKDANLLQMMLIYKGSREFKVKNVKNDFFPDVNGDRKLDKTDLAALTAATPDATACKAQAKR